MTKGLVSRMVFAVTRIHANKNGVLETFDIRYDNELAHQYYGEGDQLTQK